ncbi:hypothetical protein [Mesorhizobium sangaii]|uniref:Uncharacterized protein n=1 Tax=Mesorhizobium sangaii TaxID=505389 RepID=A0A841PFU0_9HYPH|nr:hypothetical protein [Mesorhizobium sangaii]MBB6412463.1 hypothetical protein [Mesorhizobium sangaii]
MTENHSGAFDGESVRRVFRKSAVERLIAKREWRMNATLLARELTELDEIDPDILKWIVRK